MSRLLCVAVMALSALLSGCSVTVRSFIKPGASAKLEPYSRIYVALGASSGAVSAHGATGYGISSSAISNGASQAEMALEQLKNELLLSGFDVQAEPSSADAIASFSIGEIRFDPLAGWIADQALLVIRDARTSATVASFAAEDNGITATTSALIQELGRVVREQRSGASSAPASPGWQTVVQ